MQLFDAHHKIPWHPDPAGTKLEPFAGRSEAFERVNGCLMSYSHYVSLIKILWAKKLVYIFGD